VIVVSMQILGVTMLAAAIVIPPIVARLLTNSFGKMMLMSVGIGAFCGLGGIYVSYYIDVSSGATVVLFSAALFVIVLAYTSVRQRVVVLKGKRLHRHSPALQDAHLFD
ncbi:MAG: metal ABC transporter permease, partial [Chloroflexi bacterium]|nr:metal ABC transporter permease [Chloroflexota bacterium]